MAHHLNLTWTKYKEFLDSRNLTTQWIDTYDSYRLFVFWGPLSITCLIPKNNSSDQTDFETNYQPAGNQPISSSVAVDAIVTPSTSSKLVYADMLGIARGTTVTNAAWSTLYSYSGSGGVYGWSIGLASAQTGWLLRFVVDGQEIFSANGILTDDISSGSIYNLAVGNMATVPGINISTDTSNIKWSGALNLPIKYSTSIQVLARRSPGSANKVYNGGLIVLTKE